MELEVVSGVFAICRLDPANAIPAWATQGDLFAVTRTPDELSIVCHQSNVPQGVQCERDWRALKVAGPLDFGLTGVLASLASPLAAAGISIFALSTFDTDYLLVKADCLEPAIDVLRAVGHRVAGDENPDG